MMNANVKMPAGYELQTGISTRPLAFVDLEFSGLGAEHEILSIGCVLAEQPGLRVTAEWGVKVIPEHIETADPESLRINGYTAEGWRDAVPLREALEDFNKLVAGAVLIGFNIVGDFYQLKKSFHQVGLEPEYHWQVLDVQSMAFWSKYGSGLKGFRMTELIERLGLPVRKWHDALADAQATYDIYKKLRDEAHG
jgi:DNA polymerase III epsilon subunit-like protein